MTPPDDHDAAGAATPLRFGVGVPADVQAHLGGDFVDAASRWCEKAETFGFDFVTLPHHRFTPGYPWSPWVTLGALAARTSALELGTAVFLLALDHPLDVAEAVATVDQLSGGRVVLGVGLGYRRYEWDALQLPYDRRGSRMDEALQVVQRALTEESVTFHGEHFHFDDVTVFPRPVRRPRPPVWVGANGPAGIRRAARMGDAWIVGFGDRVDALTTKVESFRADAAASGRAGEICLMRLVGIGQSAAHVEAEWLPGVLAMLRGYRRAGAPGPRDEHASAELRQESGSARLASLADMVVAGDPDDVITGIRRVRDALRCEHLIPTFGGPDPVAALELFGRHVIPAFRGPSAVEADREAR